MSCSHDPYIARFPVTSRLVIWSSKIANEDDQNGTIGSARSKQLMSSSLGQQAHRRAEQ